MQVTPVSRTLSQVFRGNFLKIPRFQRPYSWDQENISDFWYDLVERDDDDYFMGSIVIFQDSKEKNLYWVVDGQQRLTTITIVLATIRDMLSEIGEESLSSGVHSLIESVDLDNKARFVLDYDDRNVYFQAAVQQKNPVHEMRPERGEQSTLHAARTFIGSSIKDHANAAALGLSDIKAKRAQRDALTRLRDRVLALQFISIELINEDDAYLIFETLNTRGKDLAISDLVKNLFTRLIKVPVKGMDTVRDNWNKMLSIFSNSPTPIDVDTFLAHYWLSTESYVSKAKLFKEMKGTIRKSNATRYLSALGQDALLYAEITSPSQAKWTKEQREVKLSLQALATFRVAQVLPLVLSIYRLYNKNVIDLRSLRKSLKLIENFTFQFNAVTSSRGGGGIANMYARLAQRASACKAPQAYASVFSEIREKLTERAVSSEEFEIGFLQLAYASDLTRDRALVRYVLRRFSEFYGLAPEVDGDHYTIEHIWPESQWEQLDDDWDVASIGNLLFVPEKLNAETLRNKDFKAKLSILSAAGVPMDPYLTAQTSWGSKQIDKRGRELAKVGLENIWRL